MKHFLTSLLIHFGALSSLAQHEIPAILPLRDRAVLQEQILEERLRTLLPTLMRRHGVGTWVLIAREYNEDPILETMLPSTWLAARRRTVLVVHDRGEPQGLECLAVARYDVGQQFKSAWQPEAEPDQWKRLVKLIEERQPGKIAVNVSGQYAHADGLTHSEYEAFMKALPSELRASVVSAEPLAVSWLETRTPREVALYEPICRIAHQIIAEGFSEKVIQPGTTTTEDVVWWYREKIAALKLDTWFHPTVDVQRPDPASREAQRTFDRKPAPDVIQPGDLVHVDFGITYLRLNTDTQELAYVLKPGETDAPDYLKKALAVGNRLQDILTSNFKAGRSGNQILAMSLAQARKEGIAGQIYTHPVGYHGHAAGPAIGMWDMQGGVPGNGEYLLNENTAYAIELNARVALPEWNNQEVRIMLEEQGIFSNGRVHYVDGRQRTLLVIPRQAGHLGR
ncbi:MAG: M24 family metallopeptidase [Ferruginibacter sp.]|nr:M24 family metallopeptidase [Cytophagales bacterium]